MKSYGAEKIVEKPRHRYKRLVSGQSSWLRFIVEEILLCCLSPIPGMVGIALRKIFYPFSFAHISSEAMIDRSVTIRCPSQLVLGRGCIVESYVHLLCGSNSRPSIELSDGAYIRSYSILNAGPPEGFIHIGRGSTVGHHCIVHGHGGVRIGDKVMLAGQCMLIASMHIHASINRPIVDQGFTAQGIFIEDDVWLGAGVKVLDGVTIGTGTIVGAGSVVTNDLPAYSIAAGAPALVKKKRK